MFRPALPRLLATLVLGLLLGACASAGPAQADAPPGEVDASCRVDADCAVKDVGNCCGYYPACVNKASPTFPERVRAACAKSGMAGICGFPDIQGCACVAGRCTDAANAGKE